MVTSDVSFDILEKIVKSKTLTDLYSLKREHKIYLDYDLEIRRVDNMVKNTAVEFVVHLPTVQEIFYKPGILDYVRKMLPRVFLVGLGLFFVANKVIKMLIVYKVLGFVKTGNN